MAWNEWNQPKPAPAPRAADLVAHQDDLGAVGHEAHVLHGALLKHADMAGHEPNSTTTCAPPRAATALTRHHFAMGAALTTTTTLWTSQLRALLQACAHISNHLDHTKASHARDDAKIRTTIRGIATPEVPVSRLSTYFK
ncbi:hypothetical protein GCM10010329_69750 [Streptomyces spiroverticillatus]|uniref:Uncharacterized protein n=1 Tax=Streptomyces finlayi TaxID=67296 RepID=A0A919CBJ5_9ACTN|nr:hypothetical protein [Streptomyces finlayi]GHA36642.1 hypothetical protein GCM10010329_69750 [Streptomyces spiroverticillatus]GHD01882.1 hypothetical protein GCM10010334_48040 [Streptomyces finlayi]